jgi:hypothetical protein
MTDVVTKRASLATAIIGVRNEDASWSCLVCGQAVLKGELHEHTARAWAAVAEK